MKTLRRACSKSHVMSPWQLQGVVREQLFSFGFKHYRSSQDCAVYRKFPKKRVRRSLL